MPLGDAPLLRNPDVPIGAITRFEIEQFDGDWRVFATGGGNWALVGFSVDAGAGIWREQRIERVGDRNEEIDASGTFVIDGPGRLTVVTEGAVAREVWVLWIDPDHQTAALGTPDGSFGFIALREGTYRADQVTAAEDVLDFNGYQSRTWAVRVE